MSFEEALAKSLKSIATDAALPDITVTDGELKVAATRLSRVGYDFDRTPNSLMALRAYLEGKPICLAGTAGAGKTMFFQALQKSGVARDRIVIYSLPEHGNDFVSTIVDDIKSFADVELVVDDVGTESNWNGRRTDDILSRLIAVREQTGKRTHYTTNLSAAQLMERYDERVVSRLRLCVFVPMVGADNRTASTNPADAEFHAGCADPKSWTLCAERCPFFSNGKCSRGKTVPPQVKDTTPESMCDVGGKIPYTDEYILGEARFLAGQIKDRIARGWKWNHLKESVTRLLTELTTRKLPTDCLKEFV